jgi:vacuolar protein sorting-associated protein 35
MEKLAKFVGDTGRDQEEVLQSAEKIFDLLKINIDKIIEEGTQGGMDAIKLVELQVAFMKFTLKGCPDKLSTVNHILNSSSNILTKNKSEGKLSQETIKLIGRLLSVPLESTLSIFLIPKFPTLMSYLDFSSRVTLGLRIIESLANGSSLEKLNSTEKVNILLDFIKPLLVDSNDSTDLDVYQFEYEQQSVAKLIFIIGDEDPVKQLEMLITLKNVFLKGGIKRQKFTLPPLVNALYILSACISHGYEARLNNITETGKPIYDDFVNKYKIEFENKSEYLNYIQKILTLVNDIISMLSNDYPEVALKLCLTGITQINNLRVVEREFEEMSFNFANLAIDILQSGKVEADKKVPLLILFVATISAVNNLSQPKMATVTSNLLQVSQTLVKRSDQCVAMLNCSHLYFNDVIKDTAKVQECLNKAKKFADFAMTNAQNLYLFIQLLNKYLFFIEKGTNFVKADIINDIIEIIRNHIITIKTENTNTAFLPEIERYFENTLEVMTTRQNLAQHQIFSEIQIS